MRDIKNQNMANHQYQVLSTIFEGTPSSYPSSVSTITASTATTMAATSSGGAAVKPSNEKLRCPRCNSTNTKFCYYNNYNLTQPRHFCKSCRRYWTKGGTLRNIPIGGGCRKYKPATPAASLTSATARSSPFNFRNTGSEIGFEQHLSLNPQNPSTWLPFLGIGDVVYEPSRSADCRGPVGLSNPPAHTLAEAPAVPGPRLSLANHGSEYVEDQIRAAELRFWDHNVVPAFTFTDLLNN